MVGGRIDRSKARRVAFDAGYYESGSRGTVEIWGPGSYPTYHDAVVTLRTWKNHYRSGDVVEARSEAQRREWQAAMTESRRRLRQGLAARAGRDHHRAGKKHNRWIRRRYWWQNNGIWVIRATILAVLAGLIGLAIYLL